MWPLIGSIVFVLIGAAMVLGETTHWLGKSIGAALVVVFGGCGIVAGREIVAPGALIISRRELQVMNLRRHTTFDLADCGHFAPWDNPGRGASVVVFDYARDGDSDLARENRHLMGGSRALPDNYGLRPEDLADLLNDARAAHRRDHRGT
jgi:hypothetical protein